MAHCYYDILNNEFYDKSKIRERKRENHYRTKLCNFLYKHAEEFSVGHLYFMAEPEETDSEDIMVGLLDIQVLNVQEDKTKADPNLYFTFECKRLDSGSNDSTYVDTGINEFVTGKYSSNLEYAGMIGFIEMGNPDEIVKKINERLQNKMNDTTVSYLTKHEINGFEQSYLSEHERDDDLSNISLYHLMFDYSTICKIS